jgi:hypothetical protein
LADGVRRLFHCFLVPSPITIVTCFTRRRHHSLTLTLDPNRHPVQTLSFNVIFYISGTIVGFAGLVYIALHFFPLLEAPS